MQAQLKVRGNLIVEVEGDTPVDLFRELSHAQETFEHDKCGHCGNTNLRFVSRQDEEKNEYFELHCTDGKCRARLPFGQSKKHKGEMYPKKRWDSLSESEQEKRGNEKAHADSNFGQLPHGGWYKYVPVKK